MLRRQAYRLELRPSGQQLRNLRQFAGSCRFVYNKALALNTARYNKKRLGYAGRCAQLPNWNSEHSVPVRGASASLVAGVKEPGARLYQLSEALGVPKVQEERSA